MKRLKIVLALLLLSGCVFSPEGEDEERRRAKDAWPGEDPALLDPGANLEAILTHAYVANAGLKERWWAWKAALERIPQEASQPTTLAFNYAQMFENGETSWAQTVFGVSNDPMANFVWPGKLKTAGMRALETARAAGYRFEAARLELRAQVVTAWLEFALLAEDLRLQESEVALLESTTAAVEARIRAGAGSQPDLIKARTQRDLARDRLESLQLRIPIRRADLNALLNRPPFEPIDPPASLPAARDFKATDEEVLARLAERNPTLAALARDVRGGRRSVALARQQYIPDFGLGFSADAGGVARSLMAMITAPIFRYAAIEAGIEQAKAELEMTRALRRQTERDLEARTVLLLYDLRNAERHIAFHHAALAPQADQLVESSRSAYAAGKITLSELIDSLRMRLDIRRMLAEYRVEREKLLVGLEALAAGDPS